MRRHRSKMYVLTALVAVWILSLFEHSISPYFYQVVIYIGINIILASGIEIEAS